jgi:hypothetical protein
VQTCIYIYYRRKFGQSTYYWCNNPDSALLGRLLAEHGGWEAGATKEYEEKMRVYATQAVKSSYGMATSQFGVLIDEKTSPTEGG